MEAFAASFMIDISENWYVDILGVPGAYLCAETPKNKIVLVNFEGESVYIIWDVDLSLIGYIRYEHIKKELYLNLDKALYRCIESEILWYNIFIKTLKN